MRAIASVGAPDAGQRALQLRQLQLDGGEHLAGLVVQLARDPAPLGLGGPEQRGRGARQLRAPRLQLGVQLRVLQRGADLVPERPQEPAIHGGERIARPGHDHERARRPLPHEDREKRGVRVGCGRAGAAGGRPGPVVDDVRQPLARRREDGRRIGVARRRDRERGRAPAGTDAGATAKRQGAGRPAFPALLVQRAADDRRQGERPLQHRRHDVAGAEAALQVVGQRGQRGDPAVLVLEHEQQHAAAHGQLEEQVEIVAVRHPGAARPEEGVVEVVEAPQQERERRAPRRPWTPRAASTGGRPRRCRASPGSGTPRPAAPRAGSSESGRWRCTTTRRE